MTDEEFSNLREHCRQQRLLALARHHSYEWANHNRSFQIYLKEKARRDTIAIDDAMGRFQQILEAAE